MDEPAFLRLTGGSDLFIVFRECRVGVLGTHLEGRQPAAHSGFDDGSRVDTGCRKVLANFPNNLNFTGEEGADWLELTPFPRPPQFKEGTKASLVAESAASAESEEEELIGVNPNQLPMAAVESCLV